MWTLVAVPEYEEDEERKDEDGVNDGAVVVEELAVAPLRPIGRVATILATPVVPQCFGLIVNPIVAGAEEWNSR
jgi:hypothetical protein